MCEHDFVTPSILPSLLSVQLSATVGGPTTTSLTCILLLEVGERQQGGGYRQRSTQARKRVREWKASPDDLADEARLLVTRRKKTKQERDGLTCDTADSRDSPEAQRKRSCRTQGDSCNTQGRTLGPPPLTRSLNRLKYSISVAITAAVGQRWRAKPTPKHGRADAVLFRRV